MLDSRKASVARPEGPKERAGGDVLLAYITSREACQ